MKKPSLSAPLLGCAISFAVIGCAHPQLVVDSPPRVSRLDLAPPKPPAAKEIVPQEEPMQVSTVQARPLPDFREKFIGLAELDAESLTAQFAGISESYLSYQLLKRGITRFVELRSGKNIQVVMEKSVETKPKADREQTRWQSTLDKMFMLGRVSRADYILYGSFVHINTGPQDQTTRYTFDDKQLDQYENAFQSWAGQIEARIKALEAERAGYEEKFEEARRKYIEDGGKFEDEKIKLGEYKTSSNVGPSEQGDIEVELSSADDAVAKLLASRSYQDAANREIERLRNTLEAAEKPAALVDATYAKARTTRKHQATADLWVKLIEVDTGEVVWGARVRKKAVGDEPARVDRALYPVLGKTLDLLLANSGGLAASAPADATASDAAAAPVELKPAAAPAQTPAPANSSEHRKPVGTPDPIE